MNGPQPYIPYTADFARMSNAENCRALLLDNLLGAGRMSPLSVGCAVIGITQSTRRCRDGQYRIEWMEENLCGFEQAGLFY